MITGYISTGRETVYPDHKIPKEITELAMKLNRDGKTDEACALVRAYMPEKLGYSKWVYYSYRILPPLKIYTFNVEREEEY